MLELLNVNPSSGEPIYRQLHEQIVRLIVGGQMQTDDVLPSVRQIDIAPTVARLLGFDMPEADGVPLSGVIDDAGGPRSN